MGLASHWPCVTDSSGLSTYGLNDLCKGDEHPACTPSEYGPPLPLPQYQLMCNIKAAVNCDQNHSADPNHNCTNVKSNPNHDINLNHTLKPYLLHNAIAAVNTAVQKCHKTCTITNAGARKNCNRYHCS